MRDFTLSISPNYDSDLSSLVSSPATSPVQQGVQPFNLDSKLDSVPGRRPKDVYDKSLSWWRAAIRRRLVRSVHRESEVLARMQVSHPFYLPFFYISSYIGHDTYSMAGCIFCLHFLSGHTYILHDRPSSHVFLRIP